MAAKKQTVDPDSILKTARITREGFTEYHLRYAKALNACGGQAGVELLSTHLQLPRGVVVDLEKLLIDRGVIEYTKQGRQLTQQGYKLCNIKPNFNFN